MASVTRRRVPALRPEDRREASRHLATADPEQP